MESNKDIEILEFTLDDIPALNNIKVDNQKIANDEELIKTFIGKNADKIMNKKFNFSSFFFGPFYLFYRKMFLYGLLIFIIETLIINIFDNVINLYLVDLIIGIILALIYGFLFNKFYLKYVKKKINKTKLKNVSNDELKHICNVSGGVSVKKLILSIFVSIGIVIAISIVMTIVGLNSLFGNLKYLNLANNSTYDGSLVTNTQINIRDEFSIDIPDNFTEDSLFGGKDYSYEYNKGVEFTDCSMSFYSVTGYSSEKNLIEQMQKYYNEDNPSAVSKKIINNISWYTFNYKNEFGEKYYYATKKDNNIYLFSYEINNISDTSCLLYKDQILSSINKK